MRRINIAGQKFGRLKAIKPDGYIGIHLVWLCKCDCGKTARARVSSLRSGKHKSCGCLFVEWCKSGEMGRTHGLTHSILYHSWNSMIGRCYCKTSASFRWYGGRGVRVCEFLRSSPANLKLMIGDRPSSRSLDRKNPYGNYSCGQCAECLLNNWPKNIRWATLKQQTANKRNKK